MDRRHFIESTFGAGVLVATGACASSDAPDTARAAAAGTAGGSGDADHPWGLQLYTVRSLMAEDVERTLADVAAIGYREAEFAGYFDRSPGQIREALSAAGLEAPSSHVGIELMRNELDGLVEAAATIGHHYLVVPSLPQSDRADLDAFRRVADEMNGFGEACAAAGLRFGYHNHAFELETFDGVRPLDILIEGTDPDLVGFEVDLFWLVHGGGDPFDYFSRYPGRFELCHVKDRTPEGDMVDVGAGAIDFAAIFERSEEAGLIHYFVEHDTPDDPRDFIRASYEHLASLDG